MIIMMEEKEKEKQLAKIKTQPKEENQTKENNILFNGREF